MQSFGSNTGTSAPHHHHSCCLRECLLHSVYVMADVHACLFSIQYSVCDSILLLQIYYYRWNPSASSEGPLLVSDETISNVSEETALLAGSREDSREKTKMSIFTEFLKYAGALVFVFIVGIAAWGVDEYIHRGVPRSKPSEKLEWKSQVLGWISAAMFCKRMLVS